MQMVATIIISCCRQPNVMGATCTGDWIAAVITDQSALSYVTTDQSGLSCLQRKKYTPIIRGISKNINF